MTDAAKLHSERRDKMNGKRIGQQTIELPSRPALCGSAAFVGRKEGDAAPYGLLGQSETKAAGEVPFEFRPVGYGCQDVSAVAEAGLDAGAKWFVVEQDASVGRTPLEAAAMSIDTLRKIGLKG